MLDPPMSNLRRLTLHSADARAAIGFKPFNILPPSTANRPAACPISRSLLGVKRTSLVALHMSAFDPKRTSHSSIVILPRAQNHFFGS